MELEIEKIILTRDLRKERNLPVEDSNTDVIATMKDGSFYIASFFSFKSMEDLRRKSKETNQFLGGKYFWAKGMILVENCLKDTIEQVIQHLVDEGEFNQVFSEL